MKEIKQLLKITNNLRTKYNKYGKNFTLDGKLVGDIGEVLTAEKYSIELYEENKPVHDGYEKATNKEVQIKASFKGNCLFPYDHVPDYFLSMQIDEEGQVTELYNGTGQFLKDNYIIKRNLKGYKKSYYTLTKGILLELNEKVPESDKIKIIN
jgi:hypothetical protein